MEDTRIEPIDWGPILRILLNTDTQRIILAFGLISTFLPWYVRTYMNQPLSITLFDGLADSTSLGLEVSGLFFYLGLAMCALRRVRVSGAGLLLMMISVIVGWFSVADTDDVFGTAMNAGLGWYFGIVVVISLAVIVFLRATE